MPLGVVTKMLLVLPENSILIIFSLLQWIFHKDFLSQVSTMKNQKPSTTANSIYMISALSHSKKNLINII